jgi:starvation-inducible DNA-binding protein
MDDLKKQLKETLATVFSFYLKAANFHWNVEGPDFYQYHKLFEDIYGDTYASIDPLAEHCRTLGTYAPGSFKRFAELTKIEDALDPISASAMVSQLHSDNLIVIDTLTTSLTKAQKHNQQGLMNFLADRIDQHQKWGWFLNATKKGSVS